jgi:hypothetical protein
VVVLNAQHNQLSRGFLPNQSDRAADEIIGVCESRANCPGGPERIQSRSAGQGPAFAEPKFFWKLHIRANSNAAI